ncbi:unnamed protein product [Rotaria sp. Silwood2]|nr:unnamed protein product [Rotaria sp. Silwood2]CAF4392179.1 unnamed protein product [Rotaria sp. Silwood2]CAF4582489.1 unnamed protein product [Rotaria sp. Silwood2]
MWKAAQSETWEAAHSKQLAEKHSETCETSESETEEVPKSDQSKVKAGKTTTVGEAKVATETSQTTGNDTEKMATTRAAVAIISGVAVPITAATTNTATFSMEAASNREWQSSGSDGKVVISGVEAATSGAEQAYESQATAMISEEQAGSSVAMQASSGDENAVISGVEAAQGVREPDLKKRATPPIELVPMRLMPSGASSRVPSAIEKLVRGDPERTVASNDDDVEAPLTGSRKRPSEKRS